MSKISFDFTPDPRVLIALTQTPIKPMDALCELIDNAIDSFTNAQFSGTRIVQKPTIWIELPKRKELERGVGFLRIRDNGPGMSIEQAEKAIKAGYSGNNSIDTLGLFGMGFNISTGKLGITTRFLTARASDSHCTTTTIDLEHINESKSYQLEAEQIDKPVNFVSGTQIDISNWWPEGHSNHGFVKKLIQYGIPKIREEIGRRYASILRDKGIMIIVDRESCTPFEHCVWSSKRHVVRKGVEIPARYDINTVLSTKRRCSKCRTFIPDGQTECPSCGSTEIRSVEERIYGWVGIQRFDDTNKYGIDLIRNGRAIKIGEKSAFFEFVDEFQNTIKDYPIDSQYGRIVGEIHLDFVPVDFLKQDFQRSSDEWQRAISYLRGDSSLQPNQPGADSNKSPIYKLYQGYRKVRTPGTTDMYIGVWDEAENRPKRFPNRDKEVEYYKRFLNREPGFYDDEEWWKLVESASVAPVAPLLTCDECGTQNLQEAEVCITCGKIFKGKNCINNDCSKFIPLSATICPHCGFSQIPKVSIPWTCKVCGAKNAASATICKSCKSEKGKENPLSEDVLTTKSDVVDYLTIHDLTIELCSGANSTPILLEVYKAASPLISPITNERSPVIVFKTVNSIKVIFDNSHPIFVKCGSSVIEVIASEVAAFIFDMYRTLSNNAAHTISNLTWQIIRKYWIDRVEITENTIIKKSNSFVASLKEHLADAVTEDLSVRLFSELNDEQQTLFVQSLLKHNLQLTKIDNLRQSGGFIRFVPNDFILSIFDSAPELFFNGKFWKTQYGVQISGLSPMNLSTVYKNTLDNYRNNLETLFIFLNKKSENPLELRRIDATLNFLLDNLADSVE